MQVSQLSDGLASGVVLPLVRALYSSWLISYVVSLCPQRSQRLRLRLALAVLRDSMTNTANDPQDEQLLGRAARALAASMLLTVIDRAMGWVLLGIRLV
jgi:hypothetical protein